MLFPACHGGQSTPAAASGKALVRTDFNNVAPRLGLAYQASPRTVIRSGFGVFYGRDEDAGIVARLPNNPPFVTTSTFWATRHSRISACKTASPPIP